MVFASKHSYHDIPTRGHLHSLDTYNRTFTPWHTSKRAFASWHTLKETFAFIAYPNGHSHSLHPNRTFASWHTPKRTFASWHASRGHSHHKHTHQGNIRITTYSQGDICIMTYPLKGICITGHLHLHLYKETFTSRLNMCTSIIMDKLCICTLTWDICIMEITFSKGDVCIIWTFCICILVKKHLHQKWKI